MPLASSTTSLPARMPQSREEAESAAAAWRTLQHWIEHHEAPCRPWRRERRSAPRSRAGRSRSSGRRSTTHGGIVRDLASAGQARSESTCSCPASSHPTALCQARSVARRDVLLAVALREVDLLRRAGDDLDQRVGQFLLARRCVTFSVRPWYSMTMRRQRLDARGLGARRLAIGIHVFRRHLRRVVLSNSSAAA